MSEKAIVLYTRELSSGELNLVKLLRFYGLDDQGIVRIEMSDLVQGRATPEPDGFVFVSSESLAALDRESATRLFRILQGCKEVLFHGFGTGMYGRDPFLSLFSHECIGSVIDLPTGKAMISVAPESRKLCGHFAGLSFHLEIASGISGFACSGKGRPKSMISMEGIPVMIEVPAGDSHFYFLANPGITDIAGNIGKNLTVQDYFMNLITVIMFIKFFFSRIIFHPSIQAACLIVDDPRLIPRYGFLNFPELVSFIENLGFSVSIAFIPWNYRRNNRKITRMFLDHAGKMSLSFHGCDHTHHEFATDDPVALDRKIRTGRKRMDILFSRSRLKPDNVMVFPQGAFSELAMKVLKWNNFLAAVNTEIIPSPKTGNDATIRDLLSFSILRYGGFPLFTRRYPSDGLENFALDLFLGKPCFIVEHHAFFQHAADAIPALVNGINGLDKDIQWLGPEEIICRCYPVRTGPGGEEEIVMSGNRLLPGNRDNHAKSFVVVKQETDKNLIRNVFINSKEVPSSVENGHLILKTVIEPGATCELAIEYDNPLPFLPDPPGWRDPARIAVRRHLSEFRDRYLSRNRKALEAGKWLLRKLR